VYSATSYQMLREDAIECERHNRLNPAAAKRVPYVTQVLGQTKGPIVATSDYMRALPEQVASFLGGRLLALGTDGFGRSETRKALRRFFEIDAEHVAYAALSALVARKELDGAVLAKALGELGLDPKAPPPWTV
jgi:pyruvate dehydrogenase E1 component